MGTLYGIDGALLERQYRNHLSGYLHWDQITSLEKVDDASVRCYYDKQAKRVVVETEDCLKAAFYTLGGTLLQKINGIAGGRNYFDLSPLNEKVVLIRIETGVPGKQKTYKIVME